MRNHSEEPAAALIGGIFGHLGALLGKEITLARHEMRETLRGYAMALGLILAGVAFTLTALGALADATRFGLAALGVPPGYDSLVVAAAFGLIGWAVVARGLAALDLTDLAPRRTAANLRRDAQVLKGAYHGK